MQDDCAPLEAIQESLARLEAAVERIEARLVETQRSCANMDGHIGFVEGVYAAVRQPLSFLASKVRGTGPLPLPSPVASAAHSVAASASPPATETLARRP